MKKTRRAKAPAKKARPRHKPKHHKTTVQWAPIICGIIIVIIIAIVAFWQYKYQPTKSNTALVTVNGIPVTQAQLDFQYNLLPATYRQTFNESQVLEQIIDEELVVQAAQRAGINATPADVNQRVQDILATNQLTPDDLEKNLQSLNITIDTFEGLIKRQILIDRYLNITLHPQTADNTTLYAIYNATIAQYQIGEQVTVEHVLISSQRADAALIAKQVYDQAKNGTDFCTLVQNYTDDSGSKDTCGQYTFGRGQMVPEFEKAAFDMQPGEIRLVQSQYGYHIMLKINTTPPTTQPFSEVNDTIEADYISNDRNNQYQQLVSQLRSEATIAYANGTTTLPQPQTPTIEAGPTNNTAST